MPAVVRGSVLIRALSRKALGRDHLFDAREFKAGDHDGGTGGEG